MPKREPFRYAFGKKRRQRWKTEGTKAIGIIVSCCILLGAILKYPLFEASDVQLDLRLVDALSRHTSKDIALTALAYSHYFRDADKTDAIYNAIRSTTR